MKDKDDKILDELSFSMKAAGCSDHPLCRKTKSMKDNKHPKDDASSQSDERLVEEIEYPLGLTWEQREAYLKGFKAGREAEREENKPIMKASDADVRSCVIGECCKKAKQEMIEAVDKWLLKHTEGIYNGVQVVRIKDKDWQALKRGR